MMKRAFAVFCLLAAACSNEPPAGLAEATVTALYQPLVVSKGEDSTPITSIPMTPELDALTKQAAKAAGDEFPAFDFDPAGLCQDCTGFTDLKVIPAPANDIATAAETHKLVQASFKIQPGEARTVYWDMVETPDGWVVDNILAKDFSLRRVAEDLIASVDTDGDNAVECLGYLSLQAEAVQAATPPGNVAALETAGAAWRRTAEAAYQPDQLAQYYASTIAVLDDLAPEEIKVRAEVCVTDAPK